MATPSAKPQQTAASTGSNSTNGGFYEMNVGNAQPTAIIDRYKTGQITYQQLEMWLNKFGYTPAQFGIKK